MTIPIQTFGMKLTELLTTLPRRNASDAEADLLIKTYARLLAGQDERDFVEACDRILWEDDWFPTIARLKAVIDDCATDRERHTRQVQLHAGADNALVCATCHGARYVRLGGASPGNLCAGDDGSRAMQCPDCTFDGHYDAGKERLTIQRVGGVRNLNAANEVQRDRQEWPDTLRQYRTEDGRMDVEALYLLSRELRGLDPLGDDRPPAVSGWATIGKAA